MTSPRSLNRTSFCSRLWVPTTRSTVPSAKPFRVSFFCFAVAKRDKRPIFTGNASMRDRAVW